MEEHPRVNKFSALANADEEDEVEQVVEDLKH